MRAVTVSLLALLIIIGIGEWGRTFTPTTQERVVAQLLADRE